MKRNFYDTSSLLLRADDLFSKEENIAFSSITLQELESIKSSTSKDLDIKFAARKLLHLFIRHPNEYEVFIYNDNMNTPICKKGLELTNDTKILATAIAYDQAYPDEVIFITNDLALYNIANLFFGNDSIDMVEEDKADDYTGYLQVNMSE
jgi:rRNA maturation endonuclease Nob1